ncbi:MAG: hypothetical protein LLG01_06605 [Planctomycetaceae bacterium]|nr:hypothetical protein [Planctomycetaceae bacterium]
MSAGRARIVVAAAAVVAFSGGAVLGDWLILHSGQRMQGSVLDDGQRYIIYLDKGGKASVLKSDVRQMIAGDKLPPELADAKTPAGGQDKNAAPTMSAKVVKEYKHTSRVTSLSMMADGSLLAAGGADGTVKLFSGSGGEIRTFKSPRARGEAMSVTFAVVGGQKQVLAGIGRSVEVWPAGGGKSVKWYESHQRPVEALMYREMDGQIVSVSTEDAYVRGFEKLQLSLDRKLIDNHVAATAVTVSEDGQYAVSAHRDRRLRRWNMVVKNLSLPEVFGEQLPASATPIRAVVYSQDRAIAASDKGVYMQTMKPKTTALIGTHEAVVQCLAGSPGRMETVLAGDSGGEIRLWNIQAHKILMSVTLPQANLTCLAFWPDGKGFISGCKDGTVRSWKLEAVAAGQP